MPVTRGTASIAPRANERATSSALFAPVQHPVLRSVDPRKVSEFLKERERYVDEVEEKRKQVPTMSVASFKVSVDRGLLKTMHALGRFSDVAPDVSFAELTSDHIEAYVTSLVDKGDDEDVNTAVIKEAMRTLRVPMHVADPEARMLEYVHAVFSKLESVGYGTFWEKNPEQTIKIMQSRLYPSGLKSAMQERLEFQEGLKKDVNKYVTLLCKEADLQDRISFARKGHRHKKGTDSHEDKSTGSTSTEHSSGSKRKQKTFLCLNPTCKAQNVSHVGGVKNCPNTPADEANKMLREFLKEKRNRTNKVHSTDPADDNSTMIGASFAGAVNATLCADGGSDINLLPPSVFAQLLERRAHMRVTKYDKVRKFALAASNLFVTCDREISINTELHIRHGKSLMIRNLRWFVAVDTVDEPLLGRPIQEALGFNAKEILEAACDRFSGIVNAADIMNDDIYPDGSIARILSTGLYHPAGAEAGNVPVPLGEQRCEFGVDTKEELDAALDAMLKDAEANGLSEKGKTQLRQLLSDYRDVFRVRLGPGPPANVEPMRISLLHDATPCLTKLRRYPAEQREYMSKFVDTLLEFGFAKPNANAEWASAPLLVQKPGTSKYRMTFDLRRVNRCTKPVTWPMPHIQAELMDMQDSTVFASIDFCAGYWQMPLHEDDQHIHSFITPSGVYQPTRTLQGASNSGPNFQSRVEPCFVSIREALKAWLDDMALHQKDEKRLLLTLGKFFEICRERNLKISAKKTVLFNTSLRWCGYIVDQHGVQCDPRRVDALKNGHEPVTAAELSQFVNCLQWMSNFIPDFSRRVASLRAVLEKAYSVSGKRTTASIKGIRLSNLDWNNEHVSAFQDLTEQLREAVKLAHRRQDMILCVYTDASDAHWAAVVTQCDPEQLSLPVTEQSHQPLAFLGSAFNSTQRNWTTFEQEAYAVFQTFERMDYMFACEDNIHIYTDHRNLLFVFDPLSLKPSLGRHVVNKVYRWALYLSRFTYTIEHVEGVNNVSADMLTRWYAGYRGKQPRARRIQVKLLEDDLIPSAEREEFIWPTLQEVCSLQEESASQPTEARKGNDGLWRIGSRVWIPDDASDIQIRLLVAAHCGAACHRSIQSTLHALKEGYIWTNMEADTKVFVKNCIHCLVAKAGSRVPRPLSETLHASRPNEVIHFDFLFMGNGRDGLKYVLVIRDDLSGYLWLCPAIAADASTASSEIARWMRVFTVMDYWVSDQGTHFKNQVMDDLAKAQKIHHNFTVAYCPWINGTVEVCMRHIRAACTALLSEFRLGPQDWPAVIGIVMAALNSAPLVRLGKRDDGTYRSPLDVFTGLRPARNFHVSTISDITDDLTIEQARAAQVMRIDQIQKALDGMHKSVHDKVSASRRKQILHHNKQTNILQHQFTVGDFVLVRVMGERHHKLSFRWKGLAQGNTCFR